MTPERILLVGLDGMTYDIMKPLAEQGVMPTCHDLMQRGSWGVLRSTIPPLTGPAWTSFYTGKMPGNHGLFDFFKPSAVDNAVGIGRRLINSREVDGRALWHILSDHDLTSLVLNVPVTYPPSRIKGAMFTGMLTPSVQGNLTYPEGLYSKYQPELGDYTITINWQSYSENDAHRFVQDLIHCQHQRTRYTARLMDDWPDWNLCFPCFTETDRIQHALWHYIDPAEVDQLRSQGRYDDSVRQLVLEFYRQCDADIKVLIEKAGGRNVPVFFVSDHGFGPLRGKVMMNHHFAQQGLLAAKQAKVRQAILMILWRKAYQKALKSVGLLKWYKARQSRAVTTRVSGAAKTIYDIFYESIDWERTKVYLGSNTEGALYMNVKGRKLYGDVDPGIIEPEDYLAVRAEIINALKAIRNPDTGRPMLTYVGTREEAYPGKYCDIAPDIVFFFEDGAWLGDFQLGKGAFKPADWKTGSGTHRLDGCFLACGPGIARNPGGINTAIWNVTPTLLAYMGLPIPSEMDGRFIEDAFTDEWKAAHPVKYLEPGEDSGAAGSVSGADVFDSEDQEVLVERLRGLGYID